MYVILAELSNPGVSKLRQAKCGPQRHFVNNEKNIYTKNLIW